MSKAKAIRDHLRRLIADSEPGHRLPRVRDLMAQFQTSQRVVSRAVQPLVEEGFIHTRRGAGMHVAEGPEPGAQYDTDCLILYRSSDSRLARTLLMELVQRFRASGLRVTALGFHDDASAIARMAQLGRARCCLLQTNFEIVSINLLAHIRAKADSVVIDGVSVTGIDADIIGTNWREALAIAYRSLQDQGHRRIGFLTSSHDARQIAMARNEFLLLSGCREAADHPLMYQVDALPGSYPKEAILCALPGRATLKTSDCCTALIVWGLVDGYLMDSALHQRGLKLGVDFSVMILGSVDVASEHLARFDVIGNSNAEKLALFERIVRERIAGSGAPASTHYLPIHVLEKGSVKAL